MSSQAVCECGWRSVPTDARVARAIAARHENLHQLAPKDRVAARAVDTRLALEQGLARLRMWLADPTQDPARNADQVIREAEAILSRAPVPASGFHAVAPLRGIA